MNIEQYILTSLENIGQTNFDLLMRILGLIFVFFWLAIVYWAFVDVSERTKNKLFITLSVVSVLFLNFPGLIVYLMLRPRNTLEEIYWAELERKYLRRETEGLSDCPNCGNHSSSNFLVCPTCGISLRDKCKVCDSYVELDWKYCPYCKGSIKRNVDSVDLLNTQSILKPQIIENSNIKEGKKSLVAEITNNLKGLFNKKSKSEERQDKKDEIIENQKETKSNKKKNNKRKK